MRKTRVVIIGGGLSGLATAVYLLKDGADRFDVTVLEAAPQCGGQAASWMGVHDKAEETGIHLDFPWYANKLKLYEDVGQPLELVQTDGNYYICNGQTGKTDTLYAGKSVLKTLYGVASFPGLSVWERVKIAWLFWCIMRMSDEAAERYDHLSVVEFLRERGATEAMIRQLSLETVTIQGLYAHQASATSFIKFMRTMYDCLSTWDPAFFTKPTGEALIQPLVAFIFAHGGAIHTDQRVQHIAVENGNAFSVHTSNRITQCDFVIMAMPGYLVPPLVPLEYQCQPVFEDLKKLTSANVITLTLWYNTHWFPDHNVYISNRDNVIFDAVADKSRHWKEPGHSGSIVQVLIDASDDVADWTDGQLFYKSLADLGRFFPHEKYPRSMFPASWNIIHHKNIYCETRPGYWKAIPPSHETPISNLYLAGDYTAGLYRYGMESAVISGKEVANILRKKCGLQEHPKVPVQFLPFLTPR